MFKSLTMLVGATAGVAAAVAIGAPPPDQLLAHLDGGSSPISALSHIGGSSGSSGSCDTGWSSGSVNASLRRPVDRARGRHPRRRARLLRPPR